METQSYTIPFGKEELVIETGKLANLADGSVTVRWGDTVVLATAVMAKEPKPDIDFFPLTVDYEERLYAAGKISGSRFIKREGRPTDNAILTARLVDRSIRPLFPKAFRQDIQVIITVLSYDLEHDPAIIAITAASAALMQTAAPFAGPISASQVAYIDKEFILNPTTTELAKSEMDLVVSGTAQKVLMLEAGANQIKDNIFEQAIQFGHQGYQKAIEIQNNQNKNIKKIEISEIENPLKDEIKKTLGDKLSKAVRQTDKTSRAEAISTLLEELTEKYSDAEDYSASRVKSILDELIEKEVRKAILEQSIRPDGRAMDQIRPITIETAVLPRVHGVGLFTRGETQALTIATLGAPGDEQMIDTMEEEGTKRYMHHYNFPPFSTGEARPLRGTSRREIGHGALAERSLIPVLPSKEVFPYTIRLVTEVLSSNGSSSMAATCGSTLALMDAGVPITEPVAGIAMGIVSEIKNDKETYKILTDIQGVEDFSGEMDFKVTGTKNGITAIQLDVKNQGLTPEMIHDALSDARTARNSILEMIKIHIPQPRQELSPYAPRIYQTTINPERIGELIGPGGKNINGIIEQAGGKEVLAIDIEDSGTVYISSANAEAAEKALALVEGMMKEIKVGEIYTGHIIQIIKDRMKGTEIGAVVQLTPSQEGMVHISQIAPERIAKVSDKVRVGDTVTVKVMEIDTERGRISLSMKAVTPQPTDDFQPLDPENNHRRY